MGAIMTRISRRTFVAGSAAAVLGATTRNSRAAEFKYKIGTELAASHPLNVRAKEAADAITKETNGRLEIEVFPNGQLGDGKEMLNQIRSGALEFYAPSGAQISTIVPNSSINSVGFAFTDSAQGWKAIDGELGAYIRREIVKSGRLHVFDKMWDNGFRQVTSSVRPINAPADLKGLKIRVPVSPLYISMFKALGAAPVGIPFNEVYTSLQTKLIDAQENPLPLIETSKFYEVQKYCSQTSHIWDGFWMLANGKTWDALPADLKDIASKHMNAAAVAQRADVEKLNNDVAGVLKAKGLAFNTPQPGIFRNALKETSFYGDWKKTYGEEGWSILEKIVGPLT
jgi:tripartite ATP-independent transporter DctP family solute receptor